MGRVGVRGVREGGGRKGEEYGRRKWVKAEEVEKTRKRKGERLLGGGRKKKKQRKRGEECLKFRENCAKSGGTPYKKKS